jgi:hypothetical protein
MIWKCAGNQATGYLRLNQGVVRYFINNTKDCELCHSPIIVFGRTKNAVFSAPFGHVHGKTHPFPTLFHGKGWVFRDVPFDHFSMNSGHLYITISIVSSYKGLTFDDIFFSSSPIIAQFFLLRQ